MSFASIFALLVGALVLAPVVAHLLRRRRTEVRAFPPAMLVPAAPPLARRRARLEDRGLFGLRALAVIALAVLGAAPFIRCSKLNLGRRGGGSMAVLLVIDDSMSMRAKLGGGSRLDRALAGAREVLSSLREGDAVAIISAGAPARVVLATTADLGAASRALDGVKETDRATDLDGATALATSLAGSLPQPDRRIVVLSDLADGKTAPFGKDPAVPIWIPLAELRESSKNCGVVRALRRGRDVKVRVVCRAADDAVARSISLRSGQEVLASVTLARDVAQDVDLALPESRTTSTVVAKREPVMRDAS